jgi:phospholipid-binding lipoprotein MlaA
VTPSRASGSTRSAATHIPFHEADFGQTLGVWGIGPGPYLVLPLLGPSDPRDLLGKAADSEADPVGIGVQHTGVATAVDLSREGVDVINSQSQRIDDFAELRRSSLDFYAAVRSLYQQDRAGSVRDAKAHSAFATTSSLSQPAGLDQQALLDAQAFAPAGPALSSSQTTVPATLSFLPPSATQQGTGLHAVTKITH